MKLILTKIRTYLQTERQLKKEVALRNQLVTYFNADMTIKEIELFLDIKISDFDDQYFKRFYPKYLNAYSEMNVLHLLKYIDQIEGLKKKVIDKLTKKITYPVILISFSLFVLIVFKNSIVPLLNEYISLSTYLIISFVYYLSILLIMLLMVLIVLVTYVMRNKHVQLQMYNRLYSSKIIRIIQIYYETNFVYLLLTYYELAYSTKQIFSIIRKYKDNPITANLAYYAESDLVDGEGIINSINNMKISSVFKQVLNIAINSNTFNNTIVSFEENLAFQLDEQINKISKIMYTFAYVYLAILLVLFYTILSLPLQMINII